MTASAKRQARRNVFGWFVPQVAVVVLHHCVHSASLQQQVSLRQRWLDSSPPPITHCLLLMLVLAICLGVVIRLLLTLLLSSFEFALPVSESFSSVCSHSQPGCKQPPSCSAAPRAHTASEALAAVSACSCQVLSN